MLVHELKTKEAETKMVDVGGDGELAWYRSLKGTIEQPFEYCGHSLIKGDQINSSLPTCGKGVDLTKPHKVKEDGKVVKIHPPAFELVTGPVVVKEEVVPVDADPRSKNEIAEDIFIAFEEKVNPLRISRPDIIALEKRLIIERQKDAQTAIIDDKVM